MRNADMNQQIEPASSVARLLRRFPRIERNYLFGSRACGDTEPRADIDMAVSRPEATKR